MKVELSKISRYTVKKKLLGNNGDGFLQKLFIYSFIAVIGFVFLYPLFHMVSYSFMSASDIVNPLVKWAPTAWYPNNYVRAIKILDYFKTLGYTVVVAMLPSLIQTVVCSIVGYGFARFRFWGRNVVFAVVLATFIIPPQITMIPQFLMYKDLDHSL